jgi:hypothetical protein
MTIAPKRQRPGGTHQRCPLHGEPRRPSGRACLATRRAISVSRCMIATQARTPGRTRRGEAESLSESHDKSVERLLHTRTRDGKQEASRGQDGAEESMGGTWQLALRDHAIGDGCCSLPLRNRAREPAQHTCAFACTCTCTTSMLGRTRSACSPASGGTASNSSATREHVC